MNPHQVDAALFAFRSPLSKGAILADEVGLGKTIEAGLVIAQRWAVEFPRNSGHWNSSVNYFWRNFE
jgi:SNF2 family DNA or RNA helicase